MEAGRQSNRSGAAGWLLLVDRQTDKHTDRHTDRHTDKL